MGSYHLGRLLVSRTPELFTDAQACNQRTVALNVNLLQIIEQVSSLTNHFQQAAAAVMVLHVVLQMLGKVVDALGQNGNLYFRGEPVSPLVGCIPP